MNWQSIGPADPDARKIRLGDRFVGDGEPCFIVAEIGINHNGSVETAKRLIDVASQAGADAVKFQKRTIDVVYSPEELTQLRESPLGTTNGDLKRALEFGVDEYSEIDRYCKEKEIMWFASCWDEGSVDFIDQFAPPCYKIASASLTDTELLRHTCSKGKPLIISTGMSSVEQVRRAAQIVRDSIGDNFILMHCVSTYPAEVNELDLLSIVALRNEFRVPIGYSGHERGVPTSVMAAVLGACAVERHITLDRAMWGSDQSASLEPKGIQLVIRDIRMWEMARGDGKKHIHESELPIMRKLRRKDTLFEDKDTRRSGGANSNADITR